MSDVLDILLHITFLITMNLIMSFTNDCIIKFDLKYILRKHFTMPTEDLEL